MSEQITPFQFLQRLKECVKEYRKQINDTRSEEDAAHFFNVRMKSFLKSHKDELNELSQISFEKSFMSWIKNYLLKESE